MWHNGNPKESGTDTTVIIMIQVLTPTQDPLSLLSVHLSAWAGNSQSIRYREASKGSPGTLVAAVSSRGQHETKKRTKKKEKESTRRGDITRGCRRSLDPPSHPSPSSLLVVPLSPFCLCRPPHKLWVPAANVWITVSPAGATLTVRMEENVCVCV